MWLEGEIPEWLADNKPSLKRDHCKRPQAYHTWNKTERNKSCEETAISVFVIEAK